MNATSTRELAIEERVLLRWLQRYARLRWLTVGVVLVAAILARLILGANVVVPVLVVIAGVACYDIVLRLWQRWQEQRSARPGDTARLRQRLVLIGVVADLLALTVLLHFVGGVETPLFLFYFVHVGFASIMLARADAFKVMVLAMALFVVLAGSELMGWLPHVQLTGFAPPGLYLQSGYVATLGAAFAIALVVLTVGLTSVVGLLRDQWQQRARERELQLADLDRMRTFFLGLASHDLKTPLAVVSNYLQTILDGFVGEVNQKQKRWMERANQRVLELIRLIDDFVDVSQLAPDRIVTEMRSTSLHQAVERSILEIQHQVDEREVILRIDVPSQLPAVRAAPRRLQRVLTNLLVNAVTCSPRRGEVLLSVCQQEQVLRVDVLDAGPGIPRRYLPDVFQDYLQVQRAEFVPGAGLGLSTARKVIEAHGGAIWVESPCFEDGKGCRFAFTLPCESQGDDSPRE